MRQTLHKDITIVASTCHRMILYLKVKVTCPQRKDGFQYSISWGYGTPPMFDESLIPSIGTEYSSTKVKTLEHGRAVYN